MSGGRAAFVRMTSPAAFAPVLKFSTRRADPATGATRLVCVVALLSLPFGQLWQDWIRVVVNSPGDLTYSFPEGPDRLVHGHVTFALQRVGADWKVETLTWAWVRAGS